MIGCDYIATFDDVWFQVLLNYFLNWIIKTNKSRLWISYFHLLFAMHPIKIKIGDKNKNITKWHVKNDRWN
jgi:hypothetical protein